MASPFVDSASTAEITPSSLKLQIDNCVDLLEAIKNEEEVLFEATKAGTATAANVVSMCKLYVISKSTSLVEKGVFKLSELLNEAEKKLEREVGFAALYYLALGHYKLEQYNKALAAAEKLLEVTLNSHTSALALKQLSTDKVNGKASSKKLFSRLKRRKSQPAATQRPPLRIMTPEEEEAHKRESEEKRAKLAELFCSAEIIDEEEMTSTIAKEDLQRHLERRGEYDPFGDVASTESGNTSSTSSKVSFSGVTALQTTTTTPSLPSHHGMVTSRSASNIPSASFSFFSTSRVSGLEVTGVVTSGPSSEKITSTVSNPRASTWVSSKKMLPSDVINSGTQTSPLVTRLKVRPLRLSQSSRSGAKATQYGPPGDHSSDDDADQVMNDDDDGEKQQENPYLKDFSKVPEKEQFVPSDALASLESQLVTLQLDHQRAVEELLAMIAGQITAVQGDYQSLLTKHQSAQFSLLNAQQLEVTQIQESQMKLIEEQRSHMELPVEQQSAEHLENLHLKMEELTNSQTPLLERQRLDQLSLVSSQQQEQLDKQDSFKFLVAQHNEMKTATAQKHENDILELNSKIFTLKTAEETMANSKYFEMLAEHQRMREDLEKKWKTELEATRIEKELKIEEARKIALEQQRIRQEQEEVQRIQEKQKRIQEEQMRLMQEEAQRAEEARLMEEARLAEEALLIQQKQALMLQEQERLYEQERLEVERQQQEEILKNLERENSKPVVVSPRPQTMHYTQQYKPRVTKDEDVIDVFALAMGKGPVPAGLFTSGPTPLASTSTALSPPALSLGTTSPPALSLGATPSPQLPTTISPPLPSGMPPRTPMSGPPPSIPTSGPPPSIPTSGPPPSIPTSGPPPSIPTSGPPPSIPMSGPPPLIPTSGPPPSIPTSGPPPSIPTSRPPPSIPTTAPPQAKIRRVSGPMPSQFINQSQQRPGPLVSGPKSGKLPAMAKMNAPSGPPSLKLPPKPLAGPPALPSGGPPVLPSGGPPALPSGGPPALPSGGPPPLPSGGPPALPSGGPPPLPSGGPPASSRPSVPVPSSRSDVIPQYERPTMQTDNTGARPGPPGGRPAPPSSTVTANLSAFSEKSQQYNRPPPTPAVSNVSSGPRPNMTPSASSGAGGYSSSGGYSSGGPPPTPSVAGGFQSAEDYNSKMRVQSAMMPPTGAASLMDSAGAATPKYQGISQQELSSGTSNDVRKDVVKDKAGLPVVKNAKAGAHLLGGAARAKGPSRRPPTTRF